jgi:hypothetical protein
MLPGDEVRVLEAMYHLEPETKFIDIPPHPPKKSISRETIVRGTIVGGYDKALIVKPSGAHLAVSGVE